MGALGALAAVGSVRLGLGAPTEPGPGLLPFAAALVLFGSCAAVLARDRIAPGAWRALVSVERTAASAVLVGGALLFEPLGYRLTTLLTVTLLVRIFGIRRWSTAGAVGLLAAFGSYALFADLLGMMLPQTSWGL